MPVRVVHQLEAVEINEDQRELERVAVRAVNLRIQHEIQMPRVVEAGAVVGDRELMNALDVPRIFDGNRGVVGKRLEQREISRAEALRARCN